MVMIRDLFICLLFLIPRFLFASEGETSFFNKYFWFTVANFTIYVGILYYLLKKPTLDFFKNRKKNMEEEASEAEKFLDEAKQQLKEYKELMENIDKKVNEIKEYTVKTEEKEVEAMLKAAEVYAEKIKEDAKRIAQQESDKAIEHLRGEVAELAVEVAEKSLRKLVNMDIQEKLVDETIESVRKVGK